MFRSMLRFVFHFIFAGLICLGGLSLVNVLSSRSGISDFNHDEIESINPSMVIDRHSLVSNEIFLMTMNQSVEMLHNRGVLIQTPFGTIVNPNARSSSISVIIQSGGGQVGLGLQLQGFLKSLQQAGIRVECHVSEAQSMAFYIMVTSCDKVIAKKDVILMQHRVTYGGTETTPSTYLSDIQLSYAEASRLGIDPIEWRGLTRGSKDKVFSKEEVEKYNLVHEWVN